MVKHKLTTTIGAASLSLLGVFAPVSISLNSHSQTFLPVTIGNASAHAQLGGTYLPPKGRGRMQRTEGSGARGCTNSIPVTLNLLTPSDHIARTTSARPTFLWHISNATTAPMIFTLTAPGQKKPIHEERLKANKAGIMKLELPENAALEVGREYRWTLSLVCNGRRPSQNIYARAWVERVPVTNQLKQSLATAKNDRERALAYTQAGIWYDGMSILNNLQSSRLNPSASELFTSLLKQVGLNQIATATNQGQTK
jgi:hypothetical protein